MRANLTQVPGKSACCGGLLWVPLRGISKYWVCGTCRQACDREPAGSLTRAQIEKIQDDAAAGELRVTGVEPAQLVFLAQMALEGDHDAWKAVETLHASGELSAQPDGRNNTGQPGC